MDALLLHPAFADPTQPYLSLPTLKGWLRARGQDARVVDLNLEPRTGCGSRSPCATWDGGSARASST
jgi:hypothetical protein